MWVRPACDTSEYMFRVETDLSLVIMCGWLLLGCKPICSPFSRGMPLMSADQAEMNAALQIYVNTVTPEPSDHMTLLGAEGKMWCHMVEIVSEILWERLNWKPKDITPKQRPYSCRQSYLSNKLGAGLPSVVYYTICICLRVCVCVCSQMCSHVLRFEPEKNRSKHCRVWESSE